MWPFNRNKEEDWHQTWDARVGALEKLFGKSGKEVWHSTTEQPIEQGGGADVLLFPNWVEGGEAYVTAELTNGDSKQIKNSLGFYELMVCGKAPPRDNRFCAFVSHLACCTTQMRLEAGHTMSIPNFFRDSSIEALLFVHPNDEPATFKLNGRRCGVLLAIGITGEELRYIREGGNYDLLLVFLMAHDVYPFTIPGRPSVPLPKDK